MRKLPQYISPAVLGGSVVISIYQNGQTALANQTLSVGVSANSPIYCGYAYTGYTYVAECYNNPPYGNVYAPLGNDEFIVAMYDSQNHLLSITPGGPGGGFTGAAAPASVYVTSSGATINAYTYPVLASVGIETPTSCVPPGLPYFGSGYFGWSLGLAFVDAGGYPILGQVANPVTLTLGGSWSLFGNYSGQLASSYTIYDTSIDTWAALPAGDGASGTFSTNGPVINLGASSSMSLYAVDRLALAPTSGGLYALGLYDGGPSVVSCGAIPLATYDTATPIGFLSPAGIVEDDYSAVATVVDVASSNTVVDAIEFNQYDFAEGFLTYNFHNALPVSQVTFAGASHPVDTAISPAFSGGDEKVYVLDASGSISMMDYSSFIDIAMYGLVQGIGSLGSVGTGASSASAIAVFPNLVGNDSLFVADAGSPGLYELDGAPTSTNFTNINVVPFSSFVGASLDASAHTTAVTADTFYGNVVFRAVDGSNGYIITCNPGSIGTAYDTSPGCTVASNIFGIGFGIASIGSTAGGADSIGFPYNGTVFVTDGSGQLQAVGEGPPPSPGPIANGFPGTPTRIFSSYDTAWAGVVSGSSVNLFLGPAAGANTSLGSLNASYVTIFSPQDPLE